jgi:branched-chain amino acid transport system substrate-binding protein
MSLNLKKCFVFQIVAAFGKTSSSGLLAAPTDVIVKIGHAAPLTGGASHLGKDDENGARLAIEEINAHGLVIGGKKIT